MEVRKQVKKIKIMGFSKAEKKETLKVLDLSKLNSRK